MNNKRPHVGVGVLIFKDGLLLLGKRKNSHGSDSWAPPGGHLEFGESFQDCAQREVLEEVGITIKNIRFGTISNDVFIAEDKHYVTIFMIAEYAHGNVQLLEPDKCELWQWCNPTELPQPLFLPLQSVVRQGGIMQLL